MIGATERPLPPRGEKLYQEAFWSAPVPATPLGVFLPEGEGGSGEGAVAGEGAGAGAGAGSGEAAAPPPDYEALEARLNAAKTALEALEPRELRGILQDFDLYRGLRARVAAAGLPAATNASLKLLELLAETRLLPEGPEGPGSLAPIRAFCNAELPGAFVGALGRLAAAARPPAPLDWLASSLYPGGGAELGDSLGVYARNRRRWLMGPRPNGLPPGAPDVDGDVTDPRVVLALAGAVRARFGGAGASLYTSDAGTDVAADPNRAEEATAWLHFGQAVCGLLSLAPGGGFVVKTYTFFRDYSRGLAALLASLFEAFSVTKPLASRPANSEVYLVGRGFRGTGPALRRRLLGLLAGRRPGAPPPPLAAPAAFAAADQALFRAACAVHGRDQVAFLREVCAFRGRRREAARAAGGSPASAALIARLHQGWLERNAPWVLAPRPAAPRRPPPQSHAASSFGSVASQQGGGAAGGRPAPVAPWARPGAAPPPRCEATPPAAGGAAPRPPPGPDPPGAAAPAPGPPGATGPRPDAGPC